MSDVRARLWPWMAATTAAICLLAPFLYAYGFCFPRGDDFDFAVKAMSPFDLPGGFYEAGREWLTWSGRFAYHFLAVFFGWATENRLFCGLVCLSAVALFWIGARLLLSLRLESRHAVVGAILATLALFACYQNLPDFYLYTDCLSVILQEAAFAVFLGLFLNFLAGVRDGVPTKGLFCRTLIAGLFAIGVYEHAAFAIAWTLLATFLILDWSRSNSAKGVKELKKLAFFISCGLCASLLAPGNFARKDARGVDFAQQALQLAEAPAEWIGAVAEFAAGSGIWAFLFLGVFLASCGKGAKISFRAAAAILFAFAGFSLTVVFAQALSDAPFSSTPKFAASLGFYAALCEILLVFVAMSRLGAPMGRRGNPLKRIAGVASLCLFFYCVATSGNFIATAQNVLNGDMALLADFMRSRDQWLSRFSTPSLWPERGLIGEIKNPRAREARVNPCLEPVAVCPAPYPVFPVYINEPLSEDPSAWPNPYAAWSRGVASIRSASIDAAGIFARSKAGEGFELRVPPELPWIGEARIVPIDGENIACSGAALALEFRENASRDIEILRPSPVFAARPLPLFFQERLLKWLMEKKDVRYSPFVGATATLIRAKARGQFAVIPLRANNAPAWPDAIFLKGEGGEFYRLSPWAD